MTDESLTYHRNSERREPREDSRRRYYPKLLWFNPNLLRQPQLIIFPTVLSRLIQQSDRELLSSSGHIVESLLFLVRQRLEAKEEMNGTENGGRGRGYSLFDGRAWFKTRFVVLSIVLCFLFNDFYWERKAAYASCSKSQLVDKNIFQQII